MSSVVIAGDSSGTVTLQAPSVAGSSVISLGANTGTAITDANTPAFRNRIINGAMMIDQRNAGASITPTDGQYSVDRWKASLNVSSKFSLQQSSTAPAGFVNSLLATSLSSYSVGAGEVTGVQQLIEGLNVADLAWGTSSAATVTLSFWVRSSLTGTFGGSLRNSAANRSYPFSYTISAANTWEQKSVTIAGDTSGTWLTTNGIGIQLYFSLGSGSTFSSTAGSWQAGNFVSATGATSVVGTSGATFYITGVQLEKGSTATSFDSREYGDELRRCQRYYEKSYNLSAVPGTNVGPNTGEWVSVAINAGDFYSFGQGIWKVSKRASPTMTIYSTDGTANTFRQQDASNVNAVVRFASENSFSLNGSGMATNNYVRGHWTSSAEL